MNLTLKLSLSLAILTLPAAVAEAQSSSHIINLSTRAFCQTGDDVLVTEFIVQGTGRETYLMRGIGPSLGGAGVPDPLQDPTARLLNPRGKKLDFNDNWMDNPDKDQIIATGIPPTNDREAAMIDSLGQGTYTFVLQGVRQGQGVALPEIYDVFDGNLKLSAVGCRAFVQTGDNVLISGIIVSGTEPLPVLIRALGPSLADFGLSNVLPDPVLELHDSSGALIAANDNWRDTQEFEILQTGLPPGSDLESAILATVTPGVYTAVVSGLNGTTGLGFVQFYSLNAPARELNPAPVIGRR